MNSSYLWTPEQWIDARAEWGRDADEHLGRVVRTALAEHSWLVRYRPEAHAATHVSDGALLEQKAPWWVGAKEGWMPTSRGSMDPKRGHRTTWQRWVPNERKNVSRERTLLYLEKVVGEDGVYALDPAQIAKLEATLATLKEGGLPVVLFGVPMSRVMREAIPPDVEPEFLQLVARLAAEYDVPWLPESELSGPLPTPLFREQSHVNLPGAQRWTSHLATALPGELVSEALGCEGP